MIPDLPTAMPPVRSPVQIAAIVVTYNRLAQLQVTLPRLLAETVDQVIVVDNASTDATPDWLGRFVAGQNDPRLHLLRLPENTGGAGGFEAGMAQALRDHDPDWYVLMDDDARPCPGALAAFRRESANSDPDYGPKGAKGPDPVGAIAAAVLTPQGAICEMNRPSRNPFWHLRLFGRTLVQGNRAGFHLPDHAFAPDAGSSPIDVASFVGYFISRAAVQRCGLPEGGLFIYGDDVLYSLRLRRGGFGLRLDPAVRFEHDCGTMGQGFIYRPLWKIYYHCRNGVDIARMAAGPVVFPAALLWYVVLWARRGRHYTPAERSLYRRMMWTGLWHGLLRRRGRNDAVHQMVVPADGGAGRSA